jgi:hypothetical protein
MTKPIFQVIDDVLADIGGFGNLAETAKAAASATITPTSSDAELLELAIERNGT